MSVIEINSQISQLVLSTGTSDSDSVKVIQNGVYFVLTQDG